MLSNPIIGWALAALAVAVGYAQWGWQGVVLAVTVIVFWLLLQFSRTLRLLRSAGQAPLGHVDSALMLQSRLRAGMRLPAVIGLTRSLGRKVHDEPETFAWRDTGGDEVEIAFVGGRCTRWTLRRADPAARA